MGVMFKEDRLTTLVKHRLEVNSDDDILHTFKFAVDILR